MRYALCLLLFAFAPLLAAEDLPVKVEPVVDGKAEVGKDLSFKLRFTVPEGFYAYHKDNPGYSAPIKVEWLELSGLELKSDAWPEPVKKVDEFSEEWGLKGTFDITYTFTVPASAKGTLAISGSWDVQICDDAGCHQRDGKFATTVEVAGTTTAEEFPAVKLHTEFAAAATPGGDASLKFTWTFTKDFHLYHPDNPGYGMAPAIDFKELAGLELTDTTWPKPVEYKIEEDWVEWVYKDTFTVTYKFKVPKAASGELTVSGSYVAQICDDNGCFDREGTFAAALAVTPAKDTGERPVRGPALPVKEGYTRTTAKFEAAAKAGGEARLLVTFTPPKGWHAYHRDNATVGGYGIAPKLEFAADGLTLLREEWPEAKRVEYGDDWAELEYSGPFTLVYVFSVSESAAGPISLKADWTVQVCDDVCLMHEGSTSATLEIERSAIASAAVDKHGFYLDFDYALEQARQTGKPLLVDFNGKQCLPCRLMEAHVFILPEVKELLAGYVIVSVQNDIGNARYNELWDKYRPTPAAGVPYYAVMDHEAKVVRGIGSTLPAADRAHEFVSFLKGEEVSSLPGPEQPPKTGETALPPRDTASAANGTGWPEGLLKGMYPNIEPGFDFEAKFSTDKIKPGTEVTLELHFKLKKNERDYPYHLHHPSTPSEFAIPLEITLLGQEGLVPDGEFQFPGYKVVNEDLGGGTTDLNHYMEGHVIVVRKFKVPADLKPGSYRVWGQIKGQYCDDRGCTDFSVADPTASNRMFGFVASISVDPEGSDSVITTVDTNPPGTDGDSGLLWFLLLAFGAGIITLLTPCVLPVLPLTIGFFVAQSEKGKSGLLTALIYCTCIVGTFTLFGLITSLTLGATGAQNIATNGYVNMFLAIMFAVFALSFLGMFELRVPTFMTQWFTKKQMGAQKEGHGYAKAFFSGSAFSLISFSCTGPIAGTFLAQAATGSIWLPTLAMMAFASGMALPIFIMGQFPGLMKKMPKSGGWMNAMKVVFGFIEIGLAIMYLSAAEQAFLSLEAAEWVNRYVVIGVWAAVSIATAAYLFGVFRMPHDHEEAKQIGVIRAIIAVMFLSFGLYMLPGMFGAKYGAVLEGILPLPPREGGIELSMGGGGSKNDYHDLAWFKDFEEGMLAAKAANKPVFLDFTGYN